MEVGFRDSMVMVMVVVVGGPNIQWSEARCAKHPVRPTTKPRSMSHVTLACPTHAHTGEKLVYEMSSDHFTHKHDVVGSGFNVH